MPREIYLNAVLKAVELSEEKELVGLFTRQRVNRGWGSVNVPPSRSWQSGNRPGRLYITLLSVYHRERGEPGRARRLGETVRCGGEQKRVAA